jgi:hypothetical protein
LHVLYFPTVQHFILLRSFHGCSLPLHGTCLARDLRRGFLRFGVLV